MESNPDDILILTIVIQMHGKVMNFDLTPREANIFENVRLFCKVGDFIDYETTPLNELLLKSVLEEYFTKDLDKSTYSILKEAKSGVLVDNITYDKSLSTTIGEATFWHRIDPMTYIQGIYLLSIHEGRKLIYPEIDKPKKAINLLKLSDLHSLAETFHTTVPNIRDLSTEIPNQRIYIEEENIVKKDKSLSEQDKKKRIKQIKGQFYNNLYNWQLTLNGDKIESIKLSTLVELVKLLIGKPCFINLLDYSCNSATTYIPEIQEESKQYALKYALRPGDIETGTTHELYGGKKNKTKRIKKNKRRNKYKLRNRKSKKRFNR